MYQSTRKIEAAFMSRGWKYQVYEDEDSSRIEITFNLENVGQIKTKLISRSNENNRVALRIYTITKVPDSKMDNVLRALNKLNNEWLFVKFLVDSDNDVNCYADTPDCCENIGDVCVELVERLTDLVGITYQEIMKAIWS